MVSQACHQDEWGFLGATSDGICQFLVLKDKAGRSPIGEKEAPAMGQRHVVGRCKYTSWKAVYSTGKIHFTFVRIKMKKEFITGKVWGYIAARFWEDTGLSPSGHEPDSLPIQKAAQTPTADSIHSKPPLAPPGWPDHILAGTEAHSSLNTVSAPPPVHIVTTNSSVAPTRSILWFSGWIRTCAGHISHTYLIPQHTLLDGMSSLHVLHNTCPDLQHGQDWIIM